MCIRDRHWPAQMVLPLCNVSGIPEQRREGHHRGARASPTPTDGVARTASGRSRKRNSIGGVLMALNLSQKQEVVAELADVAAKAHSLVAAEYAGITVSQMTAMRKKARESGVYLKLSLIHISEPTRLLSIS